MDYPCVLFVCDMLSFVYPHTRYELLHSKDAPAMEFFLIKNNYCFITGQ